MALKQITNGKRIYATAAQKSGDEVHLVILDDAAEVIAPNSSAWPAVESAVLSLSDAMKK